MARAARSPTPKMKMQPPESAKPPPDEAQVRERARAIWIEEGMPEGREVDHWMRARRELEGDPDSGDGGV